MPESTVYDTLLKVSEQIGELTAKVDSFIEASKDGDAILQGRIDSIESDIDDIEHRLTQIEHKPATIARDVIVSILKYIGMAILGVIVGLFVKPKGA